MEKKIWSKPEINAVEFTANEYVTACTTWLYDNAGGDEKGWIFLDNGDGQFNYSYTTNTNTDGHINNSTHHGGSFDYSCIAFDSGYQSDVKYSYIADNTPNSAWDQSLNYSTSVGFYSGDGSDKADVTGKTLYDGWFVSSSVKAENITADHASKVKIWFGEDFSQIWATDALVRNGKS